MLATKQIQITLSQRFIMLVALFNFRFILYSAKSQNHLKAIQILRSRLYRVLETGILMAALRLAKGQQLLADTDTFTLMLINVKCP